MAGETSSGTQISRESYDALCAAFRGAPGASKAAANATGLSLSTAFKYWHHGGAGYPPIKAVIAKEADIARAQLEREHIEAQQALAAAKGLIRSTADDVRVREIARDALTDRERTGIEEARMAREARGNVSTFLATTRTLLSASEELADVLATKLVSEAHNQDVETLGKLVSNVALIVKRGAEAAKTAAELERLILGEPTSTVKHTFESDDVAKREIAEAYEAAKAIGLVGPDGKIRMPIEVKPMS